MMNDLRLIHTQGLDEGIRCAMCTNTIKSDKGCDGGCVVDQKMYEKVLKVIDEALEAQPRWIPISEIGYPKPEDEYKHFITIDNKGEITIQEFLLSLDEEPQPYFSGMRNIVAYINMPLPKPYKEDAE